jgi:hypothetical protein
LKRRTKVLTLIVVVGIVAAYIRIDYAIAYALAVLPTVLDAFGLLEGGEKKDEKADRTFRAGQLSEPLKNLSYELSDFYWVYNADKAIQEFKESIVDRGLSNVLEKDSASLHQLFDKLSYRVQEIRQNVLPFQYAKRVAAGEKDPYGDLQGDVFRQIVANDPEIGKLVPEIRREIARILGTYGGA